MRATPTKNGNGGWLKWAGVIITVLLLVGGFVMWCGSLSAHCGTTDIHHSTQQLNDAYVSQKEYAQDRTDLKDALLEIKSDLKDLKRMHMEQR
jgi:hypothetical protein